MAALALVGTALATVFLAVLVLWMARGIDWRSNEIFAPSEGGSLLRSLADSPVVWSLAFLAFSLGTLGLGLAVLGAFPVSLPGGLAVAVVPFALLVFVFLLGGTYAAVRERDVSPAGASLAAGLLLAVLLLVGVAGKLLMGP